MVPKLGQKQRMGNTPEAGSNAPYFVCDTHIYLGVRHITHIR